MFDLIICSQLGSSSLVLERDWKKHQCYFSHSTGSFVSRLYSAVSASAAYLTIFGNVYSSFFLSDTRSKIWFGEMWLVWWDAWTCSKAFSLRWFRSTESKDISGKGRWILLYNTTHQVFLPPPKTPSGERSTGKENPGDTFLYWSIEWGNQALRLLWRWADEGHNKKPML